MQCIRQIKGFSLVELAIVITIIGLLVAVVAAGVNLRTSSELQGMIYGITQHQAAIESFEAKYEDLPGDMTDAFDYWGADCDATDTNCNGDGNGQIATTGAAAAIEAYRAWQHLSLAGLTQGSFTGIGGNSGVQADVGINIPASPRTKTGYLVGWETFVSNRNAIRIGGFSAGAMLTGAALTPKEALAFDKKTDDGSPLTGQTYAQTGSDSGLGSNDCVTVGGAYNNTIDRLACYLSMPIERR